MMKNKNLLIGLCSVPLLLSISTSMTAQDLRERTYYYEILEPRHEPKRERYLPQLETIGTRWN